MKNSISAKEIEAVLNAIENSDVEEVIIEQPNINIHIVRDSSALAIQNKTTASPTNTTTDSTSKELDVSSVETTAAIVEQVTNNDENIDEDYNDVLSPEVGIFLRTAEGGEQMLVKLRDEVVEGQVLAYVRANGIMYEIISQYNGKITEILVENEQAVEFAQPIFRLK